MVGHYDLRLVILSVLIAIVAAYAALDLAGRVTTARRGAARFIWLCGGSVAMGFGIWAMHYIGMEAFHLPVLILYDWPMVFLSLCAAVSASWVALFLASRASLSLLRAILGSVAMGGGIAAMHYIGMDAMRLSAECIYSPLLVSLSVAIAIAVSFLALRLTFALRDHANPWGLRRTGSAVLMGLAISAMHYVGMASATFVPAPLAKARLVHAVSVSNLSLTSIAVSSLVLLALSLAASTYDRLSSLQSRALARSRRHLEAVFDTMMEAVVVLDDEHNIVRLNRAAAQLLGLPENPLEFGELRQTFEVFLPDGSPLPPGDFAQNQEVVVRRKDSATSVFVEANTVPITNLPGEGRQILITFRDISERKQMDASRTLVASIVEFSQDAIIGRDLKNRVISWNKGAEKIFGYSSGEMIGESITRLLPPDLQLEEQDFMARIRRGGIVDNLQTVRLRKDGELIHVSLTISPIKDASGKIVGASKIARDITRTKQLERQLQQSQKMDAVGQLTGGIAHDFNNLLGVVIGNLDLLERLIPGNDPALGRLRTAQKAAARGADLTRRLLAFSSAGELKPTPVPLQHAARNILEMAVRVIGPEIRIATNFDRNLPPVLMDASGFESALLNLVVNARDAMPKGGTLTITTQMSDVPDTYPPVQAGELKAGSYACVSVSDTGHGMPRDVLERAFEPFFSTKPRNRGTGLGLAMVYGFAKQSGGTARIYSEVGVGTTVSIYLPLAVADMQSMAAEEPKAVLPTRGGTALVVDDEPDLLEVAAIYLCDLGYEALQAKDGAAALKIIELRQDIELMITDVIMPGGMNGVELAHKVRLLRPGIRIVYSSGFPAGALEERSMLLLDGPLLRKPYSFAEFRSTLSQAIEAPSAIPKKIT